MNTKSKKATKLLSLMLTIAMIITVVMPTSVFAISPATITTTLGDNSIIVDTETEFTVTINPGSVSAMILGNIEIGAGKDDITSFKYFDNDSNTWEELPVSSDGNKLVGIFGVDTTGNTTTGNTTTGNTTTGNTTTGNTTTGNTTTGNTTTGNTTTGATTTGGTTTGSNEITDVMTTDSASDEEIENSVPMMDKTSTFKIKFANAGDYSAKIYAYNAESNAVLCEEEISFTVIGYADYSKVDEALNRAETYNSDEYTMASFATLETAINNAKALDRNLLETQQSVIDAIEAAINDAIGALIKVKIVPFTAVAVADDANVDYAKANKIVLVFAEPVADNADVLSKLNIAEKVENAVWTSDNTIYTLTLKADHNLANSSTVELANDDESILTKSGYSMKDTNAVVKGNLEEAYEEVTATTMTATIINADDKPYMVDGDKIVIVFNAPVYGNPATIAVSEMKFNAVADTNNTVYERVLDADVDTVEVGQDLTFVDAKNRKIRTVLTGTFGATIVPVVVRALIEDVDGTAKTVGDKIHVFFSAPTNKIAGTTESFGTSVLAGATGKWIDNQTLEITLGDTPITVNNKIDLSNLGIKDFYGTKDADAGEIELEGSFGTAIQPALLTLTAISKQGKGAPSAGDEIYLAFNVKMKEDALNLRSDFDFNYGDYGTGASVAWATGSEYAEYSTIIITLGEGANVVPGTTKITIEKELYEESGTKACFANNLENRVVTGTFGTSIAPSLINASIVKRSTKVGSQPGDQIVLLFNVPTNAAEIINLISVANSDLGNNVEEGVWSNNNTIYTITLGDGTSIENDSSITFTNTNGVLKDINNQKVASTKTLDLNGSFGVEADEVGISPSSVTATIIKTTTVAGAQAGDQIVFAFNVATNGVDLKNYFASKGIYGSTGLAGGWSNGNTIYTLILGEGTTVTDTTVVEFSAEAGIKDANEINDAIILMAGKFIGSFGVEVKPVGISPSSVTATIVKTTTVAGAQAGDKIVFTFNVATNGVDLKNYFASKGIYGSTGIAGGWSNGNTVYTLVLGEGATVTDTTVVEFSVEAGVKDVNEINDAVTLTAGKFIGSFGEEQKPVSVKPQLLRVDIVKDSGKLGIHKGDKLVFVFNVATNGKDNNINLMDHIVIGALAFEKFGEGAVGTWTSDSVFELILGEGAEIPEATGGNAIFSIKHHGALMDKAETVSADELLVKEFNGSFGVAPELILERAIVVKGDNNKMAKAQKDDKIILSFSSKTNVNENGIGADIASKLDTTLYGKGVSGAWSNDFTVYTIILGEEPKIADEANIVIPENAGLAGFDGGLFKNNTVTLEGSFGKVSIPVVISAVAYSDVDNDYIDITFNIDTNTYLENQDNYIFTSDTRAILGNYSINWHKGPNVLTIILGNNHTFVKTSEIEFTNGVVKDADELGVLADNTKVANVKGELRKPYVTSVVANYDKVTGIETLTVTFSSKTNMPKNIDLSAQYSSLGRGATATWADAKTLVITLGEGRTISVNGTGGIILNGLGITNGFDTNEVVGQYSITDGTLKEYDLEIADARVNRTEKGDLLTVTFNAATNMYGKTLGVPFKIAELLAESAADSKVVPSKTFGTDATAVWESASKLVITLGDGSTFRNANDTKLADNSKIMFKDLKFANGLGSIKTESKDITGSFDGREVRLNDLTVAIASEYTTATVKLDKQDLECTKDAVITFVIWDATKNIVTDMNAIKVNMAAVDTIEVSSKFAVKDYSKVEVYVTKVYIDTIDENTEFDVLANTVTAKKAQ